MLQYMLNILDLFKFFLNICYLHQWLSFIKYLLTNIRSLVTDLLYCSIKLRDKQPAKCSLPLLYSVLLVIPPDPKAPLWEKIIKFILNTGGWCNDHPTYFLIITYVVVGLFGLYTKYVRELMDQDYARAPFAKLSRKTKANCRVVMYWYWTLQTIISFAVLIAIFVHNYNRWRTLLLFYILFLVFVELCIFVYVFL